jgi:hypothetical protein
MNEGILHTTYAGVNSTGNDAGERTATRLITGCSVIAQLVMPLPRSYRPR